MITVDEAWKTNSWKTNQTEFFAFDKRLQILANKSGCVQTYLLYFLYTTSEEKEYVLRGVVFIIQTSNNNAVFHNLSRQIAFIQYFMTIEARVDF